MNCVVEAGNEGDSMGHEDCMTVKAFGLQVLVDLVVRAGRNEEQLSRRSMRLFFSLRKPAFVAHGPPLSCRPIPFM